MVFPSSTMTLDEGLSEAQKTAKRSKTFARRIIADSVAGNISSNEVIKVMREFREIGERLTFIVALPGLNAYAKEQYDNALLDVVAEILPIRDAADAIRDWVVANFPTSSSGFMERDTLNPDGSITIRQFSSAQAAGFRTELQAYVDSIG